jgi:hypothetical protein
MPFVSIIRCVTSGIAESTQDVGSGPIEAQSAAAQGGSFNRQLIGFIGSCFTDFSTVLVGRHFDLGHLCRSLWPRQSRCKFLDSTRFICEFRQAPDRATPQPGPIPRYY